MDDGFYPGKLRIVRGRAPAARARRTGYAAVGVIAVSFFADFAAHYEALFPARPQVREFLAARAGPGRRRLLDVGCGPGHHAGRLGEAGHDVVGVDIESAMIDAAARRYPAAAFRVLDMRRLDELAVGPAPRAPFDLAFCVGNTAAHLSLPQWPDFLARLATVLVPGGRWVLQIVNWDFVLGRGDYEFPVRQAAGPGGATLRLHRVYRDVSPAAVRFLTRLEEDGRTLWEGEQTLHPLTAADLGRLHAQTGFTLQEHLADYDGTPFDTARDGGQIAVCSLARRDAP